MKDGALDIAEAKMLVAQERTGATALTRAELAFMLAEQLDAAITEIDRLRAENVFLRSEVRQRVDERDVARERIENAEAALKAPELHWECQQTIDALEVENARLTKASAL
jgi:hypothetical protein